MLRMPDRLVHDLREMENHFDRSIAQGINSEAVLHCDLWYRLYKLFLLSYAIPLD